MSGINAHGMLKKGDQRGRRPFSCRDVLDKYVEADKRPRTKLGAFFSIPSFFFGVGG